MMVIFKYLIVFVVNQIWFWKIASSNTCKQSQTAIPSIEMNALEAIYQNLHGDYWLWNISTVKWNFTGCNNPCSQNWYGISCLTSCSSHNPSILATCGIERLEINSFNLSGIIPPQIGNLTHLQYLTFETNHLFGPFPSEIGNIRGLLLLSFGSNFLSGPLPYSIGNLVNIQEFSVVNNYFTSSVPSSFTNLRSLRAISLVNNYFTGNIDFPNFNNLNTANLMLNNFGPDLPSFLNCTNLRSIKIQINYFTGRIPVSYCLLNRLAVLEVAFNLISGDLAACFGGNRLLETFYIAGNSITGLIPNSYSQLNQLNDIAFSHNFLSGSLGCYIGTMKNLNFLAVNGNFLSGSLCEEFFFISGIAASLLDSNHLTGFIPSSIGNMTNCFDISMDTNHFYGTLPSSIGQLSTINSLTFYSNYLTGTVPSSFKDLKSLEILLLQDNNFEGLPQKFFSLRQNNLSVVDLSSNIFTGSIPVELFQLPSIYSLILSKNCFHGSISENICLKPPNSLSVVLLDGLTAGFECRKRVIDFLSATYTSNFIVGTIPSCFFRFPSLQVVDFSGNGITGSIPSYFQSRLLQNLSLSHNRLHGNIPNFIRSWNFTLLDISYNMISGDCDNLTIIDPHRQVLVLESNRLSGNIPSSWLSAEHINVVSGNLFGCGPNFQYPSEDPSSGSTYCGSSEINLFIYLFFGVMFFYGVILVWFIRQWFLRNRSLLSFVSYSESDNQPALIRSSLKFFSFYSNYAADVMDTLCVYFMMSLRNDWSHSSYDSLFQTRQQSFKNIRVFLRFLNIHRFTNIGVLLVIWIVFVPIYCILKSEGPMERQYSTHAFQYSWYPSMAFLTGLTPTIILLFFLIIFVVVVCYWLHYVGDFHEMNRYFKRSESTGIMMRSPEKKTFSEYKQKWTTKSYIASFLLIYFLIPFINIVVVIGYNAGFLYLIIKASKQRTFFAEMGLVISKVLWNFFILPSSLQFILQHGLDQKFFNESDIMKVQIFLNLMNNIFLPLVSSALSNESCFRSILIASPSVDSQYSYEQCTSFNTISGACTGTSNIVMPMSYIPPFIYSFQCSSSLMMIFSVVYMELNLALFILFPLALAFAIYFLQYRFMKDKELSSWWNQLFYRLFHSLPGVYKSLMLHNDIRFRAFPVVINGSRLISSWITGLGVLLTFGTVFPLLGIVIVSTIVVETIIYEMMIVRMLCLNDILVAEFSSKDKHSDNYVENNPLILLENNCSAMDASYENSYKLLLFFTSLFYIPFFIDYLELSIENNPKYALTVINLVIVMTPIFMLFALSFVSRSYIVHLLFRRYKREEEEQLGVSQLHSSSAGDVELETINSTLSRK